MMRNIWKTFRTFTAFLGVLLILGAVGNGDFYGYFTASDGIHILLGFALVVSCTIAQIAAEGKEK